MAETAAETHYERGEEHYNAGRLEEALAEWRSALDADPLDAHAQYAVGLALHDAGQPDEAVGHWREAISLRPDFYEPRYNLACALAEKSQGRESSAHLREVRQLCRDALALSPESPSEKAYLLRFLGAVEWNLGERREALVTVEAAIAVEPEQSAYETLSRMQARAGRWRASLTTFQELCEWPGFDSSRYEHCTRRLTAGVAILLVGGVMLVWRMTRRR